MIKPRRLATMYLSAMAPEWLDGDFDESEPLDLRRVAFYRCRRGVTLRDSGLLRRVQFCWLRPLAVHAGLGPELVFLTIEVCRDKIHREPSQCRF